MPVAAVPRYLGNQFKDASPGMRFGMYLKLWGVDERSGVPHWEMHDWIYRERGRERQVRRIKQENKTSALEEACRLEQGIRTLNEALLDRQVTMARHLPDCVTYAATATAPFTTGLGNEHPLENGFSFLWPYGLPYLPGSGVKGVLRQAARELAQGKWGETHGWDEALHLTVGDDKKGTVHIESWIDLLFGLESKDGTKEHFRGVLSFWDVIPEIAGGKLMVEIMTPHQNHYYQDGTPPHDCGQPNPIGFLTVPPGSKFTFHVQCDRPRLAHIASELAEGDRWKTLLQAVFQHAFDWLGFGAKTAVGYGAMRQTDPDPASRPHSGTGSARETDTALRAEETVWENAVLVLNPGRGELTAQHDGKKTAPLKGEAATALRASLSEDQRKRLKKKKSLKGVNVRVRLLGNQIELVGLAP